MKAYQLNGCPGLVEQRKNRLTGTVVSLYRAEQAGLDDDDGASPWATVCEEHSAIVTHQSLKLARGHLACPDWCEDCQEAVAKALADRGQRMVGVL